MIDLRERIVEELIYERVHLDAELQELLDLERDLGDSLRRAIAEAAAPDDVLDLADRCIGRVFRRMEDEGRADLERESAARARPGDEPELSLPVAVVSPAYARGEIGRRRPSTAASRWAGRRAWRR
jgi:hypothetical protein